jgi:hypothetical protein
VKVTTPLALEGPLAAEIVELPLPADSVTAWPLTGLPVASLSVTVIVEVVVPSATTDVGLATTVDVPALTGPTVNVTVAVWAMMTLGSHTLLHNSLEMVLAGKTTIAEAMSAAVQD